MDCKDMEENGTGMRTRSFRDEDYNNRRAFLRSYPLYHAAEGETANEEMVSASNKDTEKKPIKRMIISVIHWGEGKVLVLRKFKHKIQSLATDPTVTKTILFRVNQRSSVQLIIAMHSLMNRDKIKLLAEAEMPEPLPTILNKLTTPLILPYVPLTGGKEAIGVLMFHSLKFTLLKRLNLKCCPQEQIIGRSKVFVNLRP
ncbi:hypothetical protein SADUNF_Sadunf10G0048300 [Salix dunnii]|uniref:Uncharacterized protein n=1 Tax=Salix dunnii TaxID=1413687 RepID=A0A835MU88_9ROSI|nr:hypothetical protein SADUNF_Sadunf10G0048300 [Salix dunnii]